MTQITQAFVVQWDTMIRLKAQQSEPRLWSRSVDRGMITGESFTVNGLDNFDDIPENNVRHGDTVWSDAVHSARVALMTDFYDAKPVDRADEAKLLANPNSGTYMSNLMSAWNRTRDKRFYRAARATVTYKDGTTVALPSTQKVAEGGTGMTKAKLIQTRKIFRANEADQHSGEVLNFAYTSDMLEDILTDTTLTNADYMAVKMLQDGDVAGKWMGFNWVPFEGIDPVASSVYYTIAWASSGMHVGTGFVEGKSQRRADKKDTMQVSMAASIGMCRAEEKKVVEVAYR
jgi:hypothetical protein